MHRKNTLRFAVALLAFVLCSCGRSRTDVAYDLEAQMMPLASEIAALKADNARMGADLREKDRAINELTTASSNLSNALAEVNNTLRQYTDEESRTFARVQEFYTRGLFHDAFTTGVAFLDKYPLSTNIAAVGRLMTESADAIEQQKKSDLLKRMRANQMTIPELEHELIGLTSEQLIERLRRPDETGPRVWRFYGLARGHNADVWFNAGIVRRVTP